MIYGCICLVPASHGDEADLVTNHGDIFYHAKGPEDELDSAFAQFARQTPDRQPGGPDIGWSLWATRTWWPSFMVNVQIQPRHEDSTHLYNGISGFSRRGEALRKRGPCDLNPLLPLETLLFFGLPSKRGLPSLRVSPGREGASNS